MMKKYKRRWASYWQSLGWTLLLKYHSPLKPLRYALGRRATSLAHWATSQWFKVRQRAARASSFLHSPHQPLLIKWFATTSEGTWLAEKSYTLIPSKGSFMPPKQRRESTRWHTYKVTSTMTTLNTYSSGAWTLTHCDWQQ